MQTIRQSLLDASKHAALLCVLFCGLLLSLPLQAQINTERTLRVGRNALYLENYEEAKELFTLIIDGRPYLPIPYFLRAYARLYLDDFTGVVEDCDSAIARNPFLNDGYRLRAEGYIKLEQYENAIRDYEHLLRQFPRESTALHNIALCYIETKQYARADSALQVQWRVGNQPKDRVLLMRAQCAVSQGDTLLAATLIQESLQYNAATHSPYLMLADIAFRRQQWSEAEEYFTKALEYRQEADWLVQRALARYYQWRYDDALSDYDTAIEIHPRNIIAHYNRGLLRMSVGDDNRAISDFDFMLLLQPDNETALINRGILYLRTGAYERAVEDFSTVLAKHPNFIEGLSMRAEAYRAMGETGKATRDEMVLIRANLDLRYGGNAWRK